MIFLSIYEDVEVVFHLEYCKYRMGFTGVVAYDMLICLGNWSRLKIY